MERDREGIESVVRRRPTRRAGPRIPRRATTIRPVDTDDLAIEPLGANEPVDIDELVALYEAVGWSAYTREPEALRAAIAGSSFVVTARRGTRLVGLARAISDGAMDCYLQDVLGAT